MNAQEAIETLKANYPPSSYTMLCEAIDLSCELLKKSNAKPKTLEELGWEENHIADDDLCYSKQVGEIEINIEITPTHCSTYALDERFPEEISTILTKEEILAIAEKMKELGMTGEQIAKGETK
jgi:hypothetical protein